MKLFCFRHDYEIISEETFTSRVEELMKYCTSADVSSHQLNEMVKRRKIIVFKCRKCNKIHIQKILI